MSRTRAALLGSTLAFYLVIVFAVLSTSWLVELDWRVMLFRPYQQWPQLARVPGLLRGARPARPHRGDGRGLAGLAFLASAHPETAPDPGRRAAAAEHDSGCGQARPRPARPALRDPDRLGRALRRRRYISFRTHRQRRRDLGNPRLSGDHTTGQALALGRLVGAGPGCRRDHRLSRYALAERRSPRLGRRAAGPAGAPLVRAADRPYRGRGVRGAREAPCRPPQERRTHARPGGRHPCPLPPEHSRPSGGGEDSQLEPVGFAARATGATRVATHPTSLQRAHGPRSDRTPAAPAGSRRPPHADRAPRGTGQARPVPGGSS